MFGSCRWSLAPCPFADVRPNHEAACEPVAMTDAEVGETCACLGVADHLVDIDGDAAIVLLGEAFGLHVAGGRGEPPTQ